MKIIPLALLKQKGQEHVNLLCYVYVAIEDSGDLNMKNYIVYVLVFPLVLVLISCSDQNNQALSDSNLNNDQAARETLLSFLDNLHDGKYAEATDLYSSTYEPMIGQNPGVSPDDHATLFRNACTLNGMQCLQVKEVILEKKISDAEFLFEVTFFQEDGFLNYCL